MTTEYVRPDADTSRGGWTDQADGTTTIYTTLDETSVNDSDYVQSPLLSVSVGSDAIATGAYTGPALSMGTTSQKKLAQSFTSVGTTVDSATVWFTRTGSPSDGVQLKVYSDAAGVPGTQIGVTSSVVVPAGGGALETFVFTTPVAVSVGVTYWIVVERAGSLDGLNCYVVGTNNVYSGGNLMIMIFNDTWDYGSPVNGDIAMTIYQTNTSGANLKVRLLEGSTQIVEWTHSNIGATFVDAAQTLTSPQIAAISNFSNLYVELDDNAGSVYKFSLGDPGDALVAPVVVRYRYKKLLASAAYVGPGDIVSGAVGWWGLRAYNAAAIGTAAIRVRRSDAVQQDILIAVNGIIDVTDVFFNGSTPYEIVKFYDQSGNSRHSDTLVVSAYPVLLLNDNGTLPAINNVSTLETSAANPDLSQPASMSVVAQRTSYIGVGNQLIWVGSKPFSFEFNNAANSVQIGTGAAFPTATAADATTHALGGVWNNASSKIYVDGSGTTGLNIADASSSGVGNFRFPGYVPSGVVKVWEGGFWSGDISSSFAALSANQHTIWNF